MKSFQWTGKSWMERRWHREESGKTAILYVRESEGESDGRKAEREGKAALYSDTDKEVRGHY
jgi:hypothetical protein